MDLLLNNLQWLICHKNQTKLNIISYLKSNKCVQASDKIIPVVCITFTLFTF